MSQQKQLLLWVQQILKNAGHEDAQPKNMAGDWKDGKAFCYLLHSLSPTSVDPSSMEFTADNAVSNLETCFVAAEKLGIPKLLDGEDIWICPDAKSLFTYLSMWYKKFDSSTHSPGPAPVTVATPTGNTGGGGPVPYSARLREQKQQEQQHQQEQQQHHQQEQLQRQQQQHQQEQLQRQQQQQQEQLQRQQQQHQQEQLHIQEEKKQQEQDSLALRKEKLAADLKEFDRKLEIQKEEKARLEKLSEQLSSQLSDLLAREQALHDVESLRQRSTTDSSAQVRQAPPTTVPEKSNSFRPALVFFGGIVVGVALSFFM